MTTAYTYSDLIYRLNDLERLANPPRKGERGGCMSSYDRRSRYDPDTDTYIDWDANDDGTGYIRKEDDWIVAFEQEGPGVIWRVWSAKADTGNIQIFIDDATEPVVDEPFRDLFEKFNNDFPPMNFPSLVPTLSRARNRFIPIPYNRSCKIRLAPGWGMYFHFTYTTFPEGTTLPIFTNTFDRESCLALADVDRKLGQRGWESLPRGEADSLDHFSVTIPAGGTVTAREILGNRAITGIRIVPLNLPDSKADVARVLRELTLQITWDADADPSVWAPLGDFFGSVPGLQTYRSLPLGSTSGGGFYSHWFMPFSQRGLIAVSNDGDEDRQLFFTICHKPLEQSADGLLRFHAKWHRDIFLEKPQKEGRDIDWTLLLLDNGPGRFCGVQMHVWNHWSDPDPPAKDWWYGNGGSKSIDWWWGEGDEKFFVDGEKFPSSFGTGSEDYVGYAWAAEPPFPMFDSPYACQPFVELNANGHTSVNRFHICDDIPFQTDFGGYIEKYKGNTWGEKNSCLYAVVVYWYQKPGGKDPYGSWPLSERYVGEPNEPDQA
ncbi:hypothetical protein UCRPA7_5218 [Phaeoacremonium minimum UCRPA7]|uniref:DUF2961 domain-containing protein n=1 Tax=Phaeoacremonium minimum (strain UCR-PA7) TaxID=1286976 RepID=R8BIU8_PHAM7|nr:hypothetical protein UCRPA7_5218 [Phaeoacremonium minimum UCRPA7]EON99204.1 hypothetical protein UCRPA7_5218 [Phaeoacremonium minimum UCRPA7]